MLIKTKQNETTDSMKGTFGGGDELFFSPTFMKKNTGSDSFAEWCKKTGLEINSHNDIKNNIDLFDTLTKTTSKFPTFSKMLEAAVNEEFEKITDIVWEKHINNEIEKLKIKKKDISIEVTCNGKKEWLNELISIERESKRD